MDRDVLIGKISKDVQTMQKVEILTALRKLGDQLSAEEMEFLTKHNSAAMDEFEAITSDLSKSAMLACHPFLCPLSFFAKYRVLKCSSNCPLLLVHLVLLLALPLLMLIN